MRNETRYIYYWHTNADLRKVKGELIIVAWVNLKMVLGNQTSKF